MTETGPIQPDKIHTIYAALLDRTSTRGFGVVIYRQVNCPPDMGDYANGWHVLAHCDTYREAFVMAKVLNETLRGAAVV